MISDENSASSGGPEIHPESSEIHPQTSVSQASTLRIVLFGDAGKGELRAGWRLLIFLAISFAIQGLLFFLSFHFFPQRFGTKRPAELTTTLLYFFETITLSAVLIAAFVMSRIERRRMGVYGLPLRQAHLRNFAVGILWGFAAITFLLTVLWLAHSFSFGNALLNFGQAAKYAAMWAVAFILVGLSEEFVFRGYQQYTLTTGIGFWPAALLGSLYFGYVHHGNPGEQMLGLLQVVLVGLFFCFTLWRTGTLWFAVGYHAAWDWGQTFFYGTNDSGLPGRGHLLNSSFHGRAWLTGGSVGPEGSVLDIPLILLVGLLFHFFFRRRMPYPDTARIQPAEVAATLEFPPAPTA